jgi:hypothetical protein
MVTSGAGLEKDQPTMDPGVWLKTSVSETAVEARKALRIQHPLQELHDENMSKAAEVAKKELLAKAEQEEKKRQKFIEEDMMKMAKYQEIEASRLMEAGDDNELKEQKIRAMSQVAATEVDEWAVAPRKAVMIQFYDTNPLWDVDREWIGVEKKNLTQMLCLKEDDLPIWVQQFPIEVIHDAGLHVRKIARWWRRHASAARIAAKALNTHGINWKGAMDHTIMGHVWAILVAVKLRNVELGARVEAMGKNDANQLTRDEIFRLQFEGGMQGSKEGEDNEDNKENEEMEGRSGFSLEPEIISNNTPAAIKPKKGASGESGKLKKAGLGDEPKKKEKGKQEELAVAQTKLKNSKGEGAGIGNGNKGTVDQGTVLFANLFGDVAQDDGEGKSQGLGAWLDQGASMLTNNLNAMGAEVMEEAEEGEDDL